MADENALMDEKWIQYYEDYKRKSRRKPKERPDSPQVLTQLSTIYNETTRMLYRILFQEIEENLDEFRKSKNLCWVKNIDTVLAKVPEIKTEFEDRLEEWKLGSELKPENISLKECELMFHQVLYSVLNKAREVEKEYNVRFNNKMKPDTILYPPRETEKSSKEDKPRKR